MTIIAIILICTILTLALARAAAPQTDAERAADDNAQMKALQVNNGKGR